MKKNEITNDMKFREKCGEYGLSWDNFEVYDDVIMVNSPKRGIYVLFDKYYNTIAIHRDEFATMHLTKEQIASMYYQIYNLSSNDLVNHDISGLEYPFQNLSLKQIFELSNRLEFFIETINSDWIKEEHNNDYINLLYYIKFLQQEIDKYYLNSYKMKMLGFDYPDVFSYVRSIMKNISDVICSNLKNYPIDGQQYLGNDNIKMMDDSRLLNSIIDLLIKDNRATPNSFTIEDGMERKDLSVLSTELLKLLELPDKDFTPWFEQDAKEEIADSKKKKLDKKIF